MAEKDLNKSLPKVLQSTEAVYDAEDDGGADAQEPVIDQTHFTEDVVIEDVRVAQPTDETVKSTQPWWKTRTGLIALAIGLLVVMMVTLPLFMSLNGQIDTPIDSVSESETELEEQVSELQRQLLLLEQDIESADPLESELAFPPVDYTLTLEDALTVERLQELQQSRQR